MKPTRDRDQLLTTSDVARLLNVSSDLVRHLERSGKLAAAKTWTGQRILRFEDVERCARARGVRGKLEPPDAA